MGERPLTVTQRALTARGEHEEPTSPRESVAAEAASEPPAAAATQAEADGDRAQADGDQAPADGDQAPAEGDDDLSLVVRLHHEVVDTPSPRLALSPAQALHLANEGPARRPGPGARRHAGNDADTTIVLPDARSDTST